MAADAPYADGMSDVVVPLVNEDDDAFGVSVVASAGAECSEPELGLTGHVYVHVHTQPKAVVTLSVASSNPAEARPEVPIVHVTPADWTFVHAVAVTSVDDAYADGDVAFDVEVAVVAADAEYVKTALLLLAATCFCC